MTRLGLKLLVAAALLCVPAGCGFASGDDSALESPCQARYRVTNQWPGGFQVNVSFTWTGGHLEGWVLQLDYPTVDFEVSGWSAQWSRGSSGVVATNQPHNAVVYYGESVEGLGFNATGTGVPPNVRAITVNGSRCSAM